jgi:cellulose synthase/poly-beta-1,6-N-acetylglucosamine synthase-like glycosyltransferase
LAQSIGIDGHFVIEQSARSWGRLFMNFNGTAGIWRKSAIESAGGWEGDTLTEDMDLSYRAQLKGWRMKFLYDVVVPAELPPTSTPSSPSSSAGPRAPSRRP